MYESDDLFEVVKRLTIKVPTKLVYLYAYVIWMKVFECIKWLLFASIRLEVKMEPMQFIQKKDLETFCACDDCSEPTFAQCTQLLPRRIEKKFQPIIMCSRELISIDSIIGCHITGFKWLWRRPSERCLIYFYIFAVTDNRNQLGLTNQIANKRSITFLYNFKWIFN